MMQSKLGDAEKNENSPSKNILSTNQSLKSNNLIRATSQKGKIRHHLDKREYTDPREISQPKDDNLGLNITQTSSQVSPFIKMKRPKS